MNLLSRLQHTFHSIFELYKTSGRRFNTFSMTFVLFSAILGILVAVGSIAVYDLLLGTIFSADFEHLSAYYEHLTDISGFVMIMNVALYACYLHSMLDSPERQPSFPDFFTSIGVPNLLFNAVLIVAGVFLLLFIDHYTISRQYADYSAPGGLMGVFPTPFQLYLSSLLTLLKQFIPFVLIFFFLKRALGNHQSITKKSTLGTIVTLLIVGFIVHVLALQSIALVQTVFTGLLAIPFTEVSAWIPVLISFVFYLFLLSLFYPGLAGSVLFPFTFHKEEIERPRQPDEDLLDQPL